MLNASRESIRYGILPFKSIHWSFHYLEEIFIYGWVFVTFARSLLSEASLLEWLRILPLMDSYILLVI